MRLTTSLKLILFISILMIFGNTNVNANIVVFMDNSGSIRQYKEIFLQQINEIYKMAKDNDTAVTFVPIGTKSSKNNESECPDISANTIKVAHNLEEAREIFNFDSSFTCIAETLEAAETKGIIGLNTRSIVIISDMEPDYWNTDNYGQLLFEDYQNILRYYHKLIQWMKKDINIHIMLLNIDNMPNFDPKELKRQNIENELNQLIDRAKEHKIYVDNIKIKDPDFPGTRTFIRTPQFNKALIARVVRSLPVAMMEGKEETATKRFMYYYTIPLDKKDDIMSIMEGIIDPSIVNTFKIKIEIDRNVVNLERPEQRFVRKHLILQSPNNINSNPPRTAEYRIVNGIQTEHDEAYHYHYRIMRGQIQGKMNIFLTNKKVTRDGLQELVKDPGRFKIDFDYADLNDLTQKILNVLNQLQLYQIKDFPIGEKKVLLVLNSPNKHLLKGHRLTASVHQNSPTLQAFNNFASISRKNLSTRIGDDGQCYLKVRKQSDSEIKLVLVTYKNDIPKNNYIPIATITADMIRGGGSVNISSIPNNLEEIVDLHFNTPNLSGHLKIFPYDYSEYFELYDLHFPTNKSTIELLEGSYHYTVIFDYKNNACLNTWLIPFHVEKNSSHKIRIQCVDDLFKKRNNAFETFNKIIPEISKSMDPNALPPKLGANELTGTFEEHLTGSPLFFRRLFQYTASLEAQAHMKELKDLWRRIHYQLFVASKFGRNIVHKILEPALNNLHFTKPGTNEMIKRAPEYLRIILEKYFKTHSFVRLSPEERDVYNYEILDALADELGVPKSFITQLRL